MAKIPGLLVSPEDEDLLSNPWYNMYGYARRTTYEKIEVGKYKQGHELLHRVILSRMLGRTLEKLEMVDHKNGDTLDNRRENLRIADASKNAMNRRVRSDNKTGVPGVKFDPQRNKYIVTASYDGKQRHVAITADFEEAVAIRKAAAERHYGAFAPHLSRPDEARHC